jgi:hypothetical protein
MKTYRELAWDKCIDAIAEAIGYNPWEDDGSDRRRALNEFEIKLNAAIDAVPAVAEALDRPHRNPSKLPIDEDYKRAGENLDDAITALVDAVHHDDEHQSAEERSINDRYSKVVYEAAWKLNKACTAVAAVHSYRISDRDEYEAFLDRKRQIGLMIDPATAETMFHYADVGDPYDVLGREFQTGCVGRERLARAPGGKWVNFGELPDATRDALWARDGRKLSFPYGLNRGDDIINHPPGDDRNDMPENKLMPSPEAF